MSKVTAQEAPSKKCGDCRIRDDLSYCYVMQMKRSANDEACCMFGGRRIYPPEGKEK